MGSEMCIRDSSNNSDKIHKNADKFQSFPKDASIKTDWIKAVYRKHNFQHSNHRTRYSDHFTDDSFVPDITRKKLFMNIKSIFSELPEYMQLKAKKDTDYLQLQLRSQ